MFKKAFRNVTQSLHRFRYVSHDLSRIEILSAVAEVSILCVVLAVVVQAAGFSASFEPETGTVTGGASITSSSNASSNRYLVFGKGVVSVPVVVPTPAPTPTPTPTPAPSPAPVTQPASPKTNCVTVPSACGYPDATNTGVPAGVSLASSGTITVTTNNQVIDAKNVSGDINIRANNVTIKRTRINSGGYYPIRIFDGFTGTVIQDTEINGDGCGKGIVGSNWTAIRVNIHGCDDGLNAGDDVVVRDSYIHDLWLTATSHNDGIEVSGASNVVLQHNSVIWKKVQTACINVTTDFGPINNVLIDNNLLNGGGYTFYSRIGSGTGNPSPAGVKFTNNRITRNFYYGISSIDGSVVWSGNIWDDTLGSIAG